MIRKILFMFSPFLRMGVGILFLVAATLKYTMITTTQHGPRGGIEAFAATIERGGVIPGLLAQPVAYGIWSIEIIIGLALLTHRAPKFWARIATILIFAMTIYLVFLQIRGKTPECGCLGQWDNSIPLSIGRNALLVLALAPTLFLIPSPKTTSHNAPDCLASK